MRFFKTDDFYFFSENGLKEIKEYYRCHKLVKITRYESFLNEIENNAACAVRFAIALP